MSRYICTAGIVMVAATTFAEPAIQGRLITAGVTGGEATAHAWIEENLYLSQLDIGWGQGTVTAHTPPGVFKLELVRDGKPLSAGAYSLFTLCYDAAPAFGVNWKVEHSAKDIELETPAHYSVMYDTHYDEWGKDPWVGGDDFYQTFVATSNSITRVATKLADKSGDHYHLTLNYAIYATGDGPPSTWKRISPVRSRFLSEGTDPIIHIFWVPFRTNEVKIEAGKTYAVRLWRNEKSQSDRFALVARRDTGDGYEQGHLYAGDEPMKDRDAYLYVSGGEAGTIINHAPVGDLELKALVGGGTRFGQTFKASGTGLAGVDMIYTTGVASPPSLPVTIQIYDEPGGKQIGPTRLCYGIPRAFQGRVAAVWRRGEIKLTPGKMYYVEWSTPNGCNTWKLNEDLPGEAYVDGEKKSDADLAMSIVEYVGYSTID